MPGQVTTEAMGSTTRVGPRIGLEAHPGAGEFPPRIGWFVLVVWTLETTCNMTTL